MIDAGIRRLVERRDEAAIDLEPVERQLLQIGQARIAGTEVVERRASRRAGMQLLEPRLSRSPDPRSASSRSSSSTTRDGAILVSSSTADEQIDEVADCAPARATG